MADILLVEDKDSLRRVLRLTLENAGYSVTEAIDARAALNEIANSRHRLVLTDLRMPNGSGLDVLRSARAADPDVPVIVMTAFGSIDEAVQAMKDGAHDFLQKSQSIQIISCCSIERALEQARLRTENVLLREEWSRRYGFPRILGESETLKRAVGETQRVAQTEATVLLLGESGTGKELFARAVHHLSARRDHPFVAINCAAIPETLIENELFGHERGAFTGASDRRQGKFELASGGTVFLDEIESCLWASGKLLRAIEEKMVDRIGGRAPVAVDVRVVAATNKDLKAAIENGRVRGDLFFRLAVIPIEVPPLRDRGDDIVLLAQHFASEIGRELRGREAQLRPESIAALKQHHWPGTVRELENAIERACIISDSLLLQPSDLGLGPSNTQGAETLDQIDLSERFRKWPIVLCVAWSAKRFVTRSKRI